MVPSATIIIREATVFIGIWTAADSDIDKGLLAINYFGKESVNHSYAFLNGQQIMFQTHFTIFFITVLSSNFNGMPVHVHVKQPQPHSVVFG